MLGDSAAGPPEEVLMRARSLRLTAAQRQELEQARDRDPRAYLRERAAALLKLADGATPPQVAAHGLHRRRQAKTVCRWLDAYLARGLAGLVQRPRRPRGLPPPAAAGGGRRGAPSARALRPAAGALAAQRPAPGAPVPGGLLRVRRRQAPAAPAHQPAARAAAAAQPRPRLPAEDGLARARLRGRARAGERRHRPVRRRGHRLPAADARRDL